MNCEEFVLPPLELALPVVKEALRCICHTIFFARSIGGDRPVDPVPVRSDLLGLSYCRTECDVEPKIREFAQKIESPRSLTLVVTFYVPRAGAKTLWAVLSQSLDDRTVFERWRVQVNLAPDFPHHGDQEDSMIDKAASQVKQALHFVIKRISLRMDHLPPPPAGQLSYHFELSLADATVGPKSPPASMWSPQSIAQSIRSIPFIT